MAAFIGSWKQESVDGLDEVLKSLGVGFLKRKAVAVLPLTLTFSRTDDQYGLTISTSAQSFVTSFQPDIPYADQNPDGKPVQVGDLFKGTVRDDMVMRASLDDRDNSR
ncbi:unnamed protein product [Schistocephalus solidus]|uniref:Lipocln_cytosolic_FA-bd_dom domain-containing protein n=1 Tax=Schistocephalus solidus TaxID=70667 RepID=A0A183SU76_SCHSO|nr:unnamed protein product [Schistocephalus solidus]